MDLEKIGKFIQELRKGKKMTQQELADKLNVTDRAISHWENGRRMPDVSLYKPLCEVFNISVNELISGERIDKKNIMEKSDENIISTLNMNNKNKRKSKIIIGSLLIILLTFMISVIVYYRILYPKFDIYAISISTPNDKDSIKKYKTKDNITIWYYGLDELLLFDNYKSYMMKDALEHYQTSI